MGRRHRSFIRKPSLKKRVAARTSWKRAVRHSMGLKAPRGYGWLTNPKKAAYNRVYNRTSVGCATIFISLVMLMLLLLVAAFK
jgi:hypothetical protein